MFLELIKFLGFAISINFIILCIYTIVGDHPELQFESGNQIGGTYPCICGANIRRFYDLLYCFQNSSFKTLEARRQKVMKERKHYLEAQYYFLIQYI